LRTLREVEKVEATASNLDKDFVKIACGSLNLPQPFSTSLNFSTPQR